LALESRSARCDELILSSTKPFWPPDATVLKPLPVNEQGNEAPERRNQGAQTVKQGHTMFGLGISKANFRGTAIALAAIGALTFSHTADADPLPLYQLAMASPAQTAPRLQSLPSQEQGVVSQLPARLQRQVVSFATREAPGTVIIDTPNTYLYLVLGHGQAMRYGIGVGRDGFTWSGVQSITRKSEWPDWIPPAEMIARQPYLPRYMAGGPGNPLGARAMYLGGTVYRIHGTNAPGTIGTHVSSGCIRLTNEDVADLYSRVNVGTKVVVLPMDRRADNSVGRRG
jgi:lipoprotein-anchoring transpeptidase ErfK/SrfK